MARAVVASPADAPRNPHKLRRPDSMSATLEAIDPNNSDAALALERWPLLVFGHRVWPQRRDNGLSQKISRQSSNGTLRRYRRVDRSSSKMPR
jgi:hypothetical protein